MSAREWKPGDVAVIRTAGGDREVVGLRDTNGWAHLRDYETTMRSHSLWSTASQVEVIRPLVVIDPEDREQARDLWAAWIDAGAHMEPGIGRLQAALRSLVAPPKPDEPTGLGAVVEDVDGKRYIRTADTDCSTPWSYANNYSDHEWSDVAAVRVLSEGVS